MVDRMLKVALLGSTWVLYLLLALSVVSLAAMVERWFFFRRASRRHGEAARRASPRRCWRRRGRARELPGREPARSRRGSLREALRWWNGGRGRRRRRRRQRARRARRSSSAARTLLGTLGNNAPFIGLFGTVLGVIEAFHELGAGATKAAMGNVMSGIAEALVATGVGLFVALPAVVAYNVLQKRICEIEASTHGAGQAGHRVPEDRRTADARAVPGLHVAWPSRSEETPMASTQGRRRPIVGINVTPMVDVVLVLLVIMMVSATYIVSQSFKVELPKTATSDDAVAVAGGGHGDQGAGLLFNDEPVDEPTLARKLATAYAGQQRRQPGDQRRPRRRARRGRARHRSGEDRRHHQVRDQRREKVTAGFRCALRWLSTA